jgi:glycosyltransferase involved in cell wall biosynthesis
MRIHLYSGNRIEPWDYRNVFETGIGGSETSHVELAIRLAKRGHDVESFTALPGEQKRHRAHGVYWLDLEDWEPIRSGTADLTIVYRQPAFGPKIAGTRAWLVCQDVFYPDWKSEDVAHFEKIIGLCPRHLQYLRTLDPSISDKLVLSGNGVNVERCERAERDPPVRNPTRLIWASSPDRGLKELLDIFQRAQERVPDLELHIFYGMDNIDKICGGDRTKYPWRDSWKQYDRAQSMAGVVWRGRIGQDQLAREYLSSGIWCYPTWFQETSCISCMEAQALGAIPITNPIWATGYNVKHGVFIEGTPSDRLVLSRYVDAVVRLASNPDAQEAMRAEMMAESRARLSWEVITDQWHQMAEVRCAVGA